MTMPRLSRWLLPLSLALNVFLGTLAVMHPPFPPRHEPPDPAQIIERIAASLPPADAVILRRVFAAHAADLDRAARDFHAMPDRILALLAAPRLDEDALRAVMAANREAHTRLDDTLGLIVVEVVPRLSPEGRAALARFDPRPGPGGPRP